MTGCSCVLVLLLIALMLFLFIRGSTDAGAPHEQAVALLALVTLALSRRRLPTSA